MRTPKFISRWASTKQSRGSWDQRRRVRYEALEDRRVLATYSDVAADVGLVLSHETAGPNPPFGSGSAWSDYDNDGDIDLYVTNNGGANRLYMNQGDTSGNGLPNFVDVAATLGVDDPENFGHSAVFIDYDNDGDQDLFVTSWGSSNLFQNQLIESGAATFLDVTSSAGLVDDGRTITSGWADFDQDGILDVYLARHKYQNTDFRADDILYRGTEDGTFEDVTAWLGPAGSYPQANGLGFSPGWFDFDNDRDLDL